MLTGPTTTLDPGGPWASKPLPSKEGWRGAPEGKAPCHPREFRGSMAEPSGDSRSRKINFERIARELGIKKYRGTNMVLAPLIPCANTPCGTRESPKHPPSVPWHFRKSGACMKEGIHNKILVVLVYRSEN